MKIKKMLAGLAVIFSLASVSMPIAAKSLKEPKSYIVKLIKNSKNDEEKQILQTLFSLQRAFGPCVKIKEDFALKNLIKERFVEKEKELSEFNKEDLKEILNVLQNKKKKYENYIENNPEEKLTNEYAKNNINLLKKAVSYVEKLKNDEISKKEVNLLLKVLKELKAVEILKDFDYDKPNSK